VYTSYYGLKETPFNMTPDVSYLFLSDYHKEALDHLFYGVTHRKGFMVIFGGVGTGKTTVCRAFLNRLDPSIKSALVFNTVVSELDFLETVNQEFGIDTGETRKTKKQQIDLLNRFLLENYERGGNAVLVVDEAQNLSPSLLEQIRMLSNLETDKEKLIQIVLVGQPELADVLSNPNLKQLNERITVRYRLKPLDRSTVKNYIDHRLVLAGNRGGIRFTKGAMDALYLYSQGNPRRINALCDRALLVAYCRDEFQITKDTIQRAIDDIKGESRVSGTRKAQFFGRKLAPVAAVMLMAFMVANLGGKGIFDNIARFLSGEREATALQGNTTLQGNTLVRKSVTGEAPLSPPHSQTPTDPDVDMNRMKEQPQVGQKEPSSLVLDKRGSLGKLFKFFNVADAQDGSTAGEVYPNLFSYDGDPLIFRTFQKPFQIRIKGEETDEPGFLFIQDVTQGGAIAIDDAGKRRPVTNDFILSRWDGEMSWIYPYEHMIGRLSEGMSGLSVLRVQKMLEHLGYPVEPRGVYDSTTAQEVTRFQLNFGLEPSGEVDTSTHALMYQMTEEDLSYM